MLGTLLSILSFVWFASGLVMIDHGRFPRIDSNDRLLKNEPLTAACLPSMDSLRTLIPDNVESITLDRYLGQTVLHVKAGLESADILTDAAGVLPEMNWERVLQVASLWNDAPIERVDTLHKLDQWIPFGRNKSHLPIYKFYFDDSAKHQLYISSQTCEPLQYTDADSRFWAWLGPIPHWIYFTSLRQDTDLWIRVVIWLSGLCCIMLIAGIYLGIRDFRLARKMHRISPFRKFWYKWHHIMGLVFGIFALMFCFSGMMSLAKVEDLCIHAKLDINPVQELRHISPSLAEYSLDYRLVLEASKGSVLQLEWSSFGDIPIYIIRTAEGQKTVDARTGTLLNLTREDVVRIISRIHGGHSDIDIELMDDYDTYYLSSSRKLDLPVWKVKVADIDGSTWYINPSDGQCRYMNTPSRWRHWTYRALHSLNIKFLVDRPWLWNILMWGLMIAGTFISISALPLAVKYIIRLCRRNKH